MAATPLLPSRQPWWRHGPGLGVGPHLPGRVHSAAEAAASADLARQGTLVADIQLRPGDDTWPSEVRQFQVEDTAPVLDLTVLSQIWRQLPRDGPHCDPQGGTIRVRCRV